MLNCKIFLQFTFSLQITLHMIRPIVLLQAHQKFEIIFLALAKKYFDLMNNNMNDIFQIWYSKKTSDTHSDTQKQEKTTIYQQMVGAQIPLQWVKISCDIKWFGLRHYSTRSSMSVQRIYEFAIFSSRRCFSYWICRGKLRHSAISFRWIPCCSFQF